MTIGTSSYLSIIRSPDLESPSRMVNYDNFDNFHQTGSYKSFTFDEQNKRGIMKG